jgi:hypothetical protein
MLVMARAFPSSLLRALRSPPDRGVGWYFGAIDLILQMPGPGRWSGRIECRPAAVVFMAAGPVLASVVEQPLSDILPDRVSAIQADRVGLLNFDDALATAAGNAQHVALNF